ncbi:MAG: hypothetical protein MJZ93_03145 [Paludibacteraceae bacterium]|nr:hypothetical protein [Paludibacteraceae bacterium]
MKKILISAAIVATLCLTSCSNGFYRAYTTNTNLNQTQVVLSQNNFKVVKVVETTIYFKNSFRFKKDQLQQSAYAALLKEANLQNSQALINVTLEEVVRSTAMSSKNSVRVTGLVIEFTK